MQITCGSLYRDIINTQQHVLTSLTHVVLLFSKSGVMTQKWITGTLQWVENKLLPNLNRLKPQTPAKPEHTYTNTHFHINCYFSFKSNYNSGRDPFEPTHSSHSESCGKTWPTVWVKIPEFPQVEQHAEFMGFTYKFKHWQSLVLDISFTAC